MNLNLILAKTLQFVTFVFFNFMILVFAGAFLMLALAIMVQPIRLLAAIGIPTVLAVMGGISLLVYLGLALSRRPELYNLIYNMGRELIEFGYGQVKRFDPLVEAAKTSKNV